MQRHIIGKADRIGTSALTAANWHRLLTPTNLTEERERFLVRFSRGEHYEPVFQYDTEAAKEYASLSDELSSADWLVELPDELEPHYVASFSYYAGLTTMVSAFFESNDDRFTAQSAAVFGKPDEALLKEAAKAMEEIIGRGGKESALNARRQTVEPTAMAEVLRKKLRRYSTDWTVSIVADAVARVSVDSTRSVVTISRSASFNESDLQKLTIHEIDSHVARSNNGRKCWNIGIFSFGFAGAEEIDEGLALFNERAQGIRDVDNDFRVVSHVLGIELAIRSSFWETFEWARDHFHRDTDRFVFDRVLRWRRGIHDQSVNGAFCKDIMYFRGLKRVAGFVQNGGSLADLYWGVISLEQANPTVLQSMDPWRNSEVAGPILPPFLSI